MILFDGFLARSSHPCYPRGKFELECEDSIGHSREKNTHTKANELNLKVASEGRPEDNILPSLFRIFIFLIKISPVVSRWFFFGGGTSTFT